MKSILDPSFRYTPSTETDLAKTFARVWAELEARERAEAGSGSGCTKVRPERDDELVGIGSVGLLGFAIPKPPLIVFVCPRCNRCHESREPSAEAQAKALISDTERGVQR